MIKLTPSSPAGRSFLRSIRDKEKRWAKQATRAYEAKRDAELEEKWNR